MKQYLGLNLGPIYRTISNMRKTRELWAASYLFSWIMKRILIRLHKAGKGSQILTPYLDESDRDEYSPEKISAGIYTDRLIMEAQDGDLELVKDICEQVIETELVKKAKKAFPGKSAEIKDFFTSYFQSQIVQVPFDKEEAKKLPDSSPLNNPMKKVNAYLDSLGLVPLWNAKEEQNWVWNYIKALNQHGGRLIKSSFGEKLAIQSIAELSSSDLKQRGTQARVAYKEIHSTWKKQEAREEDEIDFIKQLKNHPDLKSHFRSYHKYIAVVHADADNMGNAIGTLEHLDQFQAFSEVIIQASKATVKEIQDYGGLAIYVGGEDIVFFAPVFSSEKSVFHLADTINEKFQAHFKTLALSLDLAVDAPSLSFGISITYYKYPLEEAVKLSRYLCEQVAKKETIPHKSYHKNAIAFQILKHGGQIFRQVLWRDSPFYKVFKDLLEQQLTADEKAINSLVHSLEYHGSILRLRSREKENIKYLLDNNFDEGVHKQAHIKNFLYGNRETDSPGITDLVFQAYQDYGQELLPHPETHKPTDMALASLYSVLRSIQFLIQEDHD